MGSLSETLFCSLPQVETDEIFDLMAAFRRDTHPDRVNLGAGVYCSNEGLSQPLKVVAQAEKILTEQNDINRHDYRPIRGDPEFLDIARELTFSNQGNVSYTEPSATESRVISVQTISGTGANHIGARFLAENMRPRCVWLSDPTWGNHNLIWDTVGVAQRKYPYYRKSNCEFDFAGMMAVLNKEARPHDIIVLHACAHNPTGMDPSREQWMGIAELCQRKQLFPFFDSAYQGFASGDTDQDAWAIRYFYQLQHPIEMCVAQSFSKNFGLYGQRAGAFHLVVNSHSASTNENILNNLCQLIRSEYSVSPRFGSDIVKTVLKNKDLTAGWHSELKEMSARLILMRQRLYDEICRLQTPGSWEHIINQTGMFSYTGLTCLEVEVLQKRYHIYMHSSGRISIAGLNTNNVQYVAAAISAVRAKSIDK